MFCSSCKSNKNLVFLPHLNVRFCKKCYEKYIERIIRKNLRLIDIKRHDSIKIVGIKSNTLDIVKNYITKKIKKKKVEIYEVQYFEDLEKFDTDLWIKVTPSECVCIYILAYFFEKNSISYLNKKNLIYMLSELESNIYFNSQNDVSFFRSSKFKLAEKFFYTLIEKYPKFLRSLLRMYSELCDIL